MYFYFFHFYSIKDFMCFPAFGSGVRIQARKTFMYRTYTLESVTASVLCTLNMSVSLHIHIHPYCDNVSICDK